MGGLLKYMPLTAATALVASLSISGVPLFSGFASKWSIYVATVQGSNVVGWLSLCAAIAILTSALTLASFIKFFGASFLSRSSALVKEKAAVQKLEVGLIMQMPQVLLAVICLLLGIMPAIAYKLIYPALAASPHGIGQILGHNTLAMPANMWAGLGGAGSRSLFVPLALVVVLGLTFLVARFISKLGGAKRRVSPPWLCGYARESECNRYVAHGYYGEIKRYFRWLGGAPAPQPDKSHSSRQSHNPEGTLK
jgi:NADH:ubiquinone oxidoreductase subunit 5 (subunit L)/multisubunit Na+/H+ antiporter MnhA subunit